MIDWLAHFFHTISRALQGLLDEMTTPIFVVAVLVILMLERVFPAKPAQKTFSIGFFQDVVWALVQAIALAMVVRAWMRVLRQLYERHLDFLALDFTMELPSWLSLLLAFLLMDFLRWLQHAIQHKQPWLWQFHAVHHSQRDMNLFSDFRIHPVDLMVRPTVYFLPLAIFGVSPPEMVWLGLILVWQARLYHANVRMNFGPLRYLFVTPQSHRIHHSVEARHHDKNFGACLSIWDRVFGTQWHENEDYPDTGIRDEAFPRETSTSVSRLIPTTAAQLIYPFTVIGKALSSRFRR